MEKRVAVVAADERVARAWIVERGGDIDEAEIVPFSGIRAIRGWDKAVAIVGKWSELPDEVQRELGAWNFKHPNLDAWVDSEDQPGHRHPAVPDPLEE